MATKQSIDLRLLGHFEALSDGLPLVVSNSKAQALLAYLAMPAGRRHRRETLAALLWAELSQERARSNLRTLLFNLRRSLTPACSACLCAEGETLFLDPATTCVDVTDFEQTLAAGSLDDLAKGVALYRGDFLDGLIVDEAQFDDWLRNHRQQLHERAVQGLVKLLAHQQSARDSEAAIQTALRLLAMDPFQEAVHRDLMRLYVEAGRPGAAREQYRMCVDLIRRELGVEPEAETRELHERLVRSRGASPQPTRVADRPDDRPPAIAQIAADPETPLIGRDAELSRLRTAVDEAVGGHGSFIVIVGAAGIGKTRLLTELAAAIARRGGRTLQGRAYEMEQMLPFGPWVDGLRRADVAADAVTLAALGPTGRDELARLLPELGAPSARMDAEFDYLRLFECISRLFAIMDERQPLGVLLDDVHWADSMSLRLLAFLARRAPVEGFLCAIALREEELAEATMLRRLIADMERERAVVRLALSPLSQSETLSLIGVLAPPDHDFGDRVWKTSEGNPFMAIESVRALLDDGDTEGQERSDLPLRIRGIVAGRLDRLTGRARQLLAAAAVIGRDFEFELMRTAAGLDEAESVAGVEELVARHILRGSGARFDFTHDVIRQIAYDELLPPRRKLLHRRTAEELERDRPGRQGPSNATLARHYLAAEVWGKAARYWRSAGADAVERSAYRESVTCFEQALTAGAYLDDGREATEHAIDTRLDLYHALIPLGQPARLIGILREADERAAAVGAQARLGWIAAYRANCLWLRGEPDLAAEASERARKVATALDIFDLRIVADFYLGQAYHFAGRYRDAVGVLKENIERLGNDRAQERFGLPGFASVILRGWLCWSLAELGEFEESMAHGQQALKIAEAADHPFSLLDAYREVGCLYIRLGDFPRATALLERGLALAQSRDLALWLPSIGSALGYALALSGRHSEGLALLDQSVEQASTLGIVAGHAQRIAWLAEAHLFVGEAARAETLAEHALELSTQHNERGHRAWCLRLIGEIALRRPDPDPEKAAEFFIEALGSAEGLGMLPLAVLCQRGLAEASPQLGRRESG